MNHFMAFSHTEGGKWSGLSKVSIWATQRSIGFSDNQLISSSKGRYVAQYRTRQMQILRVQGQVLSAMLSPTIRMYQMPIVT